MSNSHERQIRLREIGQAGQRELSRATVVIPAGPAGNVAREYLLRSGVEEVVTGETDGGESFPHGAYFTTAVCRQFAEGAWLATDSILAILGLRAISV